jgi:NAD(P)-dependent dehydrogenase (short-subunit alcohol dehydrogenase family)
VVNHTPRGVAVVTGAGRRRGIGRAIARRLAGDGFEVVVHQRSSDPATSLPAEAEVGWDGAASVVSEIIEAGGHAVSVTGDLLDDEIISAVSAAASELGPLACVVNNAGTAGMASAFQAHETSVELWEETMLVNVSTVHRLCAALVPALVASTVPQRSIVNLSSTAGHRVLPWYGAYCASKAAVERLTEQQAIELAPHGIRVNAIAPGSTSTDMIDGTLGRAVERTGIDPERLNKKVIHGIPLGRFSAPEEIGSAVSFLAGSDASFVTGQILTVDGGMSLV